MSLHLVVLVVAPYPLGELFLYSSHAMVYNRYGYALFGLVMMGSFLTRGDQLEDKGNWIGGMSSGAAAALVLFLKISYFFGGVLLIGGSVLLLGYSRRRLLGTLFGFSLVAVPLLAYLGFDVGAILRDWDMAASARFEGVSLYGLGRKLFQNTPYLLLLIYLGIRGSLTEEGKIQGRHDYHLLHLGILVFAADILVNTSGRRT